MQSILKLAALLLVALFVALAAIHVHQDHGSRKSRSWPEHILALSPRPASLQDQQSESLMSWLFDSQHSVLMAARAPFSTSFNASALSPAKAAAVQQPSTCDVLALNGGPGSYNKSRHQGLTQLGLPCDPFEPPEASVCISIPLPTPWSDKVLSNLSDPLPEYPRPQMARPRWHSLNGIWEFEPYSVWEDVPAPFGRMLHRRIVVPYPVEAPLSGVGRADAGTVRMWYRRSFTVPRSWLDSSNDGPRTQRVMLNFGAVDWEAEVFVNGQRLGQHRGGYDKFSFDITDALAANGGVDGTHELAVRVFDPTEFAHIPVGKQRRHPSRHPSSIWYTSSSGIWQTVWLEPVSEAHITRLDIIPDIDDQLFTITVHGSPAADGLAVRVSLTDHPGIYQVGAVGKPFNVSLQEGLGAPLRLWSFEDPHLYNLDVTLFVLPRDVWVDAVSAYVGMRKMSLGRVGPSDRLRPLLNNEFVFQLGFLDQGFWPDGLYTAPTDEALQSDILFAKRLGYNLLRKHIKVEPDRWYYHCDRLGMLVWQDMPSMYWEDPFSQGESYRSPSEKAVFEQEMVRHIEEHQSFPSIVTYIIFNEGWGQYETERVTALAKSLDASRLFTPASGWVDAQVGDIIDMHAYVGPSAPTPTPTRAAVLGEFGGLGLRLEGHLWIPQDSFCYEMQATPHDLEVRYLALIDALRPLMLDPNLALSAAVYTELSDVEAEINGLITYDRQVVKVEQYALPAAHKALLDLARSLNKPMAQAGLLPSLVGASGNSSLVAV